MGIGEVAEAEEEKEGLLWLPGGGCPVFRVAHSKTSDLGVVTHREFQAVLLLPLKTREKRSYNLDDTRETSPCVRRKGGIYFLAHENYVSLQKKGDQQCR